MKKIVASILLVCGILLTLTACGKPFTCDLCFEEKSGISHSADLWGTGTEYVICHDCYSELKELAQMFND